MSGVSGISVSDFLYNLFFHIFGFSSDFSKEFSAFGRLKSLSNHFVPFLSVANQNWPDYLGNIPNFRLGNLQRSRNLEQVDFNCSPFSLHSDVISITGECKDWDSAIDVGTLEKKLIPHIPQHSNLHLVFTRSVQSQYYSSLKKKGNLSYTDAFGNHLRAKDFIFFKLKGDADVGILHEIRGLPSQSENPTCVVIFILCPSQLNPKTVISIGKPDEKTAC
jgi:hypothetical protein